MTDKAVDMCKGCVCFGCALSEKNGNVYGCKAKRCASCDGQQYIRLNYCADFMLAEEEGDILRL